MSKPRWRFDVYETFSITGRGTVAAGRMYGNMHNGEPAILKANGVNLRLDRVGIDILCRPRDGLGPIALSLPGVTKTQVPPGSVICAIDAHRGSDELA